MHTFKSKQAWWPVENSIQDNQLCQFSFHSGEARCKYIHPAQLWGVYEGLCSEESSLC